jgi:hypothetical protein
LNVNTAQSTGKASGTRLGSVASGTRPIDARVRQRPNPTLETLVRYAEAVGKRLAVSLVDE